MDYIIDGTQTEYVRTPFADNSLYLLPDTVDTEIAVFLSDVLPTSYEIGVQYGDVKNQVIPLPSLVLALSVSAHYLPLNSIHQPILL